jgi:carbamoylphosphate synthase small subunit
MREYEKEARLNRAVELLRKGLDTDLVAQRLGIDTRRLYSMLRHSGYTIQGLKAEVQ